MAEDTTDGSPRRQPNWPLWRQMALVDWHAAVALSLDLDPALFRHGFKPADYPEYWDRYGIALNHVGAGTLSCVRNGLSHPSLSLPSFAEWAVRLGWKLPDEFPRPVPAPRPDAVPATKSKDSRLGDRERRSLLRIIGALAKEAGHDIAAHSSKAAAAIEATTTSLGGRVSRQAVEGHLKRAAAAFDGGDDDAS